MSRRFRERVEGVIEDLIAALDDIDGDPDFEPEPVEEQHDQEASDRVPIAPRSFVIAMRPRR